MTKKAHTDHFVTYLQFPIKVGFSSTETEPFSQFNRHFQPKNEHFLPATWDFYL